MTIKFDSHTHTLMSGHAFSTIGEYVSACRQKGMDGFATTDHGPSMIGSAQLIYFFNLVSLPRIIDGIRILRGVEANIVDHDGSLDIPDACLKRLDLCIASYHEITLQPATPEEHTAAWLAAARNPLVDVIGHSGRGPYPYDLDAVLSACRENGKAIEINNHTLSSGFMQHNCQEIASACLRHGVNIMVNSDAHSVFQVGQVDKAMQMLNAIQYPAELIINQDYETISAWLRKRKPWLKDI